jgi:hypothetical protein
MVRKARRTDATAFTKAVTQKARIISDQVAIGELQVPTTAEDVATFAQGMDDNPSTCTPDIDRGLGASLERSRTMTANIVAPT